MAMLEDAKKSSDKPKADKADDKHKKKKAKHPAASVPSQPEGDEGEESNDAGDQDQPDAGADDSESEDAPEGGAAPGGPPEQAQQGDGDDDQGGSDSAGDQGGAQQPAQGGGGQGATPVPSPAAPGAGDTTSGGDDTPDQDGDQDPNAQPPETPAENTPAGTGSESDLTNVPMSPGLKDEYQKANDLLTQLLYQDQGDKLATGILQGLMPQGPAKIKNAAMISLHVLVQIHKRMQLPAQLILPFAKDVAMHVMDLGQQVKQIQWSDQEATAVLGTVLESALRVFGVSKAQLQKAGHLLGKDTLMKHQQNYLAAHAHAKPAIDKNNQDWHNPHLAPQAAGGPPGPQTGAPVGAQPQAAQPGPPGGGPAGSQPAQGPPPAGGMLSQAAAAQPEGEQS